MIYNINMHYGTKCKFLQTDTIHWRTVLHTDMHSE